MIPLINYYKVKRFIRQWNPFSETNYGMSTVEIEREITINTKCAHCAQNPILPHHMGCSHIFCYVCLKVSVKNIF